MSRRLLLDFNLETYQIPLDTLMPSKRIPDRVMSARKYKQIVSSIHEIGHLRVLALEDLGVHEAPC